MDRTVAKLAQVIWLSACASAGGPATPGDDDVTPPGDCGGALPGFARWDDALHATCGDLEVTARPLAAGMIQLVYARGGATPRPSFAVVGATAPDAAATTGGTATAASVCTTAMRVDIDDSCRVRATLATGQVVIDDAEPFAADDSARLVRVAPHDRVYGLGEKTGGLDRRGRAWTMWNTDAYDPAVGGWHPGQDPMYQSIPFELHFGAVAHGVFTDETRKLVIDLGAGDATRDAITAIGARTLTQYVIAGPTLPEVVDRYTQLTGRPAQPPRWAMGFHQSRWGYASSDELVAIAQRFRAEGIPADALWLDIQHQRGLRTFTVDAPFADAATRLQQLGFHAIAIADPGIKAEPGWDVYDSAIAGDHVLHDAAGVYQGNAWPGASVFPDFSRPATRTWWGQQVGTLAARGFDGIWLDVNEPTTFPEGGGGNSVPDELAADGDGHPTTLAELHNAYALLEARATAEAMPGGFVLTRAGYAGIQRHAAVWTGDVPSTWDGLQQTLPMLLGLGMSGVPIVGSDIGGYSGGATSELYARWLALGSISPFSRAHVTINTPGQEPWMFGDDVTAAARDRLGDRYRLMPYLTSLVDEAARTGAPILRPLVWEFPADPMVADLADEAMLGPFVLAAPVVEPGATTRSVYLPAGRWYELHSGAIYDGPTTVTASLAIAALPLYVREGAVLPSWPTGAPGALDLDVYPAAEASGFTIVEDGKRTRAELVAQPDGASLSLTHDGPAPARTVTVRVHRVDGTITSVEGATEFHAGDRSLVASTADADALVLRFHYDPTITELRPPVGVTFEVHVPANTPGTICVASSATGWTHEPLAWVAPGVARGTIDVSRGDWLDYKITRGGWETVEKQGNCAERTNRTAFGSAATQTITVANWRDRCGN